MQRVEITKDVLRNSVACFFGSDFEANKKSLSGSKSKMRGIIGEVLFKSKYSIAKYIDCYDYDFLLKDKKIDIKTKFINVFPNENMFVNVKAEPLQDTDFYYFVMVLSNLKYAWHLGYISKDDFLREATLRKKGEVKDNFTFDFDHYELPIKKLRSTE